LNSCLCYLFNNYKKTPIKLLKSIVTDFYDLDTVSTAKSKLMEDITSAGLSIKLPPTRRDKTKDIDDILSVLATIDETGVSESLPRYATDNLEEIPSSRLDEGGLAVVISKLNKINDKLSWSYIGRAVEERGQVMNGCLDTNHRQSESDALLDKRGNAGQSSGDKDDSHMELSQTDDFTLVKYKKRKHGPSPSSEVELRDKAQGTLAATQTPSALNFSAVIRVPISAKPPARIIGRLTSSASTINSASGTTRIKSAKPFIQKVIFAMHNVCSDETVESVSSYIEDVCGAPPISCFDISSKKHTNGDNEDNNSSKSFRVCIDKANTEKFIDPMSWANGIVIKLWKFKPKVPTNSAE